LKIKQNETKTKLGLEDYITVQISNFTITDFQKNPTSPLHTVRKTLLTVDCAACNGEVGKICTGEKVTFVGLYFQP